MLAIFYNYRIIFLLKFPWNRSMDLYTESTGPPTTLTASPRFLDGGRRLRALNRFHPVEFWTFFSWWTAEFKPTRRRRWASSSGGTIGGARRWGLSHAMVHHLRRGHFWWGWGGARNSPRGSTGGGSHWEMARDGGRLLSPLWSVCGGSKEPPVTKRP
jgi:hypothetical protein